MESALPRYTIKDTVTGLFVTVPARRKLIAIFFMCVWLVPWAFGEISVLHQLAAGGKTSQHAFLYLWLMAWTVGGGGVLLSILWQLFGRETIAVGPLELAHRAEIFGIGRGWSYALSDVARMRAVDFNLNTTGNRTGW